MQSWKADEAARLIAFPGLIGQIVTMPERLSQQRGWWEVLSTDVLSGASTVLAESI